MLTTDFDADTQAHLRLEYRYEDFQNSDQRPTVSDMTGDRIRLTTDLRHNLSEWLSVYLSLYGERKDAVEGFDADWQAGGTAGATIRFKGPIASQPRPWSVDLAVGLLERRFDSPDIAISTEPRLDDEGTVQGTLTVPVGDTWSAQTVLGYRKVLSNYDLFTLDDINTSLAMIKKF